MSESDVINKAQSFSCTQQERITQLERIASRALDIADNLGDYGNIGLYDTEIAKLRDELERGAQGQTPE